MNPAPTTSHPVAAEPTAARMLRTADLLILSIGTFTLGVDGFVLSGLLPQVAASLHVSVAAAGQLTTLFALVYAVASPVIAAVAGDWDRRALLAAGMAVFVAGMVVQATGPDFAAVAVGRVLAATDATAAVTMAALGVSAGLTIVPQQHRLFAAVPKLAPVAVGLNGSGIYIATALGAAAGGTALDIGGSAALPVTAAVIGLLAVIVAVTTVRRA